MTPTNRTDGLFMRSMLSALFVVLLIVGVGCATTRDDSRGESAADKRYFDWPYGAVDVSNDQELFRWMLERVAASPQVWAVEAREHAFDDPAGVRVPSGTTLDLTGVTIVLSEQMAADGQVFLLEDASNVTIVGGTIVGERDAWDRGTNIAGIRVRGNCRDIEIRGTTFRDLSSNAIGVFGADDEHPVTDVRIVDVIAENCCNYYGDYLQPDSGPAKGSDRKDQGTVAFYHVNDWYVSGSRFAGSQSDGTHFYHSNHGMFVNNVVEDSKMGGYFLEGCEYVTASGCHILRNGSRGVTIERDSTYCTLSDCIVEESGREGLWAPDVAGVVVTNNIFRLNGVKDDTDRDCEIRIDDTDKFETKTADILIHGNLFYTRDTQTAAIYVGCGINGIDPQDNSFDGTAPRVFHATSAPAE